MPKQKPDPNQAVSLVLSRIELDQIRKALTFREPFLSDHFNVQVQQCPEGSTEWADTREELGATITAINKVDKCLKNSSLSKKSST